MRRSSGSNNAGWRVDQSPVRGQRHVRTRLAHLDWEADEETHRERFWALWRELGTGDALPLDSIHYVYQTASLHELVTTLRRRVASPRPARRSW